MRAASSPSCGNCCLGTCSAAHGLCHPSPTCTCMMHTYNICCHAGCRCQQRHCSCPGGPATSRGGRHCQQHSQHVWSACRHRPHGWVTGTAGRICLHSQHLWAAAAQRCQSGQHALQLGGPPGNHRGGGHVLQRGHGQGCSAGCGVLHTGECTPAAGCCTQLLKAWAALLAGRCRLAKCCLCQDHAVSAGSRSGNASMHV